MYGIRNVSVTAIAAICLSLFLCNTAWASPADMGFTKWHVQITMDETRQSTYSFHEGPTSKGEKNSIINHAIIDEIGYAPPMMFGNGQYHADGSSEEGAQIFVRHNIHVFSNGTLSNFDKETGTLNDESDESVTTYSGTVMKSSDSVDFEYQTDGTWSFSASQGIDNHGTTQQRHSDSDGTRSWSDDYSGTENLGVNVDNESPDVKLTYINNVFVIEGDVKSDSDEKEEFGGHHTDHDMVHFRAVLEPPKEHDWEAIILPQDAGAFHKYIPTGPDITSGTDAQGGNSIGVTVEVRNKKTHALYTKPFDVTYTLSPSSEPGWCMNFPSQKTANAKPDFFFAAADNPGKTIANEQLQLKSMHASTSDTAQVTSRDYGAYGWVLATVTLADGSQLAARALDAAGHLTNDGLFIPEDTDGNHIADQWERDHGVMGKPGAADDENDPSGMFNKGDGYNMYEEYRGFALGDPAAAMRVATSGSFALSPLPKYQRLNPKKRELLISIDPDPLKAGLLMYGALQYQHTTGITVLFVPSRDQLAPLKGDPDAKHPRWSNFNAYPNSGDNGPKQAAVWITTRNSTGKPGMTPIVGIPDPDSAPAFLMENTFATPCKTVWVEIDPKKCFDTVDGFISGLRSPADTKNWTCIMIRNGLAALAKKHPDWHVSVDSVETYAKAHEMVLRDELIRFTVLHELGHATGAQHHGLKALYEKKGATVPKTAGRGDPNCPMRYWHYFGRDDNVSASEEIVAFLYGKWDPSTNPYEAAKWHFCNVNWPTMRLHD